MGKLDNATFLSGDAKEQLKQVPDETVQTAVTSPPYWGLRDYGEEEQLGLEDSPQKYVDKLVDIFGELRRTLRPDGTFWLNLGDSYYNYRPGAGQDMGKQTFSKTKQDLPENCPRRSTRIEGLKEKDLVGIPWRVAFALQEDGWYLRSDIVWSKPSVMPESVTDRPTSAHEFIFLFAKSEQYYYDHHAIKEPLAESTKDRYKYSYGGNKNETLKEEGKSNTAVVGERDLPDGKNKRDVWRITPGNFPEAHFAVYPTELIEPCVKAGTSAGGQCSKCGAPLQRVVDKEEVGDNINKRPDQPRNGLRGSGLSRPPTETADVEFAGWTKTCGCDTPETEPQTVLDPFSGAGTTGIAALKNGRKYVGIDLNEDYNDLAKKRIRGHNEVPTNHDFW